ncbi:MAG TPA: methyltransferase domain-containing protein [Gaiellaceae bacterium]|jgi:ubiquinone/menaquinone biosynthesis C-methylase UbiE|nr:methyltransferase domain-containing protein [Gaiellaceae bacterium]
MARRDKDSNRAFYDTEREEDRRRFECGSKAFQAETLVPWVTSRLEPGARVLDIAGGSGVYASLIVRAAPVTVVGLDISSSMIRQRAEDPLLTENVVGDMEALPFPDSSFDAALFVGCLHHVPNPLKALEEAHRIVRPGGTVFAAEPCSLRVGTAGVAPVAGHEHEFRFSMSYLTAKFRQAGLRIENVTGKRLTLRFVAPRYHSPPLWLFRAADRIDRVVTAIPGATNLAELALIRATRPGAAPRATDDAFACPRCRATLAARVGELVCDGCGARYAVDDGVAMLLADDPADG